MEKFVFNATLRDEFSEIILILYTMICHRISTRSIGISQAFAYCGGVYIGSGAIFTMVFMNIDTGKFLFGAGTQCISGAGGRKPDDSNTTGTESA